MKVKVLLKFKVTMKQSLLGVVILQLCIVYCHSNYLVKSSRKTIFLEINVSKKSVVLEIDNVITSALKEWILANKNKAQTFLEIQGIEVLEINPLPSLVSKTKFLIDKLDTNIVLLESYFKNHKKSDAKISEPSMKLFNGKIKSDIAILAKQFSTAYALPRTEFNNGISEFVASNFFSYTVLYLTNVSALLEKINKEIEEFISLLENLEENEIPKELVNRLKQMHNCKQVEYEIIENKVFNVYVNITINFVCYNKPTTVYRAEGLNINSCKIDTTGIYIRGNDADLIKLQCNPNYQNLCFIASNINTDLCLASIANKDVANIRTYCNVVYNYNAIMPALNAPLILNHTIVNVLKPYLNNVLMPYMNIFNFGQSITYDTTVEISKDFKETLCPKEQYIDFLSKYKVLPSIIIALIVSIIAFFMRVIINCLLKKLILYLRDYFTNTHNLEPQRYDAIPLNNPANNMLRFLND